MHYLSVCSGIEAASVAWHPLGWTPLAFSEIEPFPRAVLQHHYPDVPLHGDFTVLRDEPWIVDADLLVGGTPCQAFSVAGLRNSLADERGNLTLEFVRLTDAIDDHRLAAGREPAIIVWENVPGVLSVKDNAFGCFLAALAGEDTPLVPPRGKWTNAGVVDGPKRTIAWRILDAQYFGLAQRRRRVFVVASAREGFDPAAVLLEFEGVRRDTPPRREAGQAASGGAAGGTGERSHWDGLDNPHPTLNQSHNTGGVGQSNQELFSQRGAYLVGAFGGNNTSGAIDVATAVLAHGGPHGRLNFESETFVTHSLRGEDFDAGEDGTGRGTPLVPVTYSIMPQNSGKDYKAREVEVAQPIMAGGPVGGNQGGDYILQPVAYRTTGNDGVYETGDLVHALTTATDPNSHVLTQPVAFSYKDSGNDATVDCSPTLRSLGAYDANGGGQMAVAFAQNTRDEVRLQGGDGQIVGALAAEPGMKQTTYVAVSEPYTLAIRGRGDTHNLEYRQDGTANAILTPNGGRAGIGVGAVAVSQSGETGKGDAAPCVAVFPIDMYNAKRDPEKHDAINRNAVGVGNEGDPSYTLNRVDVHGVAVVGDAAPCVAVAFSPLQGGRSMPVTEEAPTLEAGTGNKAPAVMQHMAVRRLTPVECERLQGFPDDYTAIPWKKKPAADCPDGPRYKALGNSMAVPVMRWIGDRIARHLRGQL